MGMVLSFVPRHSASGHRPPTGKPAPVIIFPGVRYERIKADEREGETARQAGQKPAR